MHIGINMCVHIFICIQQQLMKEDIINLKENREGVWKNLLVGKGNVIKISTNK